MQDIHTIEQKIEDLRNQYRHTADPQTKKLLAARGTLLVWALEGKQRSILQSVLPQPSPQPL